VTNAPSQVPAGGRQPEEAAAARQAEHDVWTPRMLECLRQGGPKGGRWFSLIDKVWDERTLRAGFARVQANDGAPGVDGVDCERFAAQLEEEMPRLSADLRAGTYRPQPARRTWIPKPGSTEQRPLGIPTVRDRVVQAALKLVIEPIFEAGFHPNSHGFRPGRKAQDALTAVQRHLHAGLVQVIDADLKGYFASIPHERLLAAVGLKIADGRIIALIRHMLKAGIMEGLTLSEPDAGTPQGGVISPLLANIYLDGLDHLMAQHGHMMERYADDFVILCRTSEEATQALGLVQTWTAEAGLVLHPTKTRNVDMQQHGAHLDFLGFRFQRHHGKDGGDRFLRLVRPKSLDRIKDAIRELTPRNMGHGMHETIRKLNQTLRGWSGYFRAAILNIHQDLDKFTRRRLRSQLCKAHRMHCWGNGTAHQRWPNAYFGELGLFSLENAHCSHPQSHRHATTTRRAVCGKTARTVRREGRPR
jgi:RNA-directed DNA polymerase